MQAMIEEMRTGRPYELPKEGMTRSKLAAGPTTLEDLVDPLLAIPIPKYPSLLVLTQCDILLSVFEGLQTRACKSMMSLPGAQQYCWAGVDA